MGVLNQLHSKHPPISPDRPTDKARTSHLPRCVPNSKTSTPSRSARQKPNIFVRNTPTASQSSAKRSRNPTLLLSTRRSTSSPAARPVGQFVYVIRKRIKLSPE